jgi:hypothetical protein
MKTATLIIAIVASLLFGKANASAVYTYSFTFSSGDLVTGSFTGTAEGNLVTDLSNITAFMNGAPFGGDGTVYNYRWAIVDWSYVIVKGGEQLHHLMAFKTTSCSWMPKTTRKPSSLVF